MRKLLALSAVVFIAICATSTAQAQVITGKAVVLRKHHRHHRRFNVPLSFKKDALCVHSHESWNWHIVDSPYANGLQFMLSTWERAGGLARTWASASPREQIYRAFVTVKHDGGSWREWPNTARMCGLYVG